MARTPTKSVRGRAAASTGRSRASNPNPPRPSLKLRGLFKAIDRKDLFWWYKVGKETLRIHPEPRRGGKRQQGAKVMDSLAWQLSDEELRKTRKKLSDEVLLKRRSKTANILWQARNLASRFKTSKELEEFRGGLSIWHVMSLLSVEKERGNRGSMEKLRDRCLDEGWSVRRLRQEIQDDRGGKLVTGRTYKPHKAATAAVAVQDLIVAARRWMIYHEKCLTGRSPILKPARRTDHSERLLRDVREAIEGLEKVQGAVKGELAELRQLAKEIKTALKE
jgi:hypothetical protein